MSVEATAARLSKAGVASRRRARELAVRMLDVALVVAAAGIAIGLVDAFYLVVTGEHELVDFRAHWNAAEAFLSARTPYPAVDEATLASGREYVYPPLTAILVSPLATLGSLAFAEGVMVVLGVAAVLGTLLVLDVRDWRCYVVSFLWVSVPNAILLGNITVFLAFGAALAWRFRDRAVQGAMAVGMTLVLKLFLWPLLVWFAATRRLLIAVFALGVGASLLVASWALVGFGTFVDYLHVLQAIYALYEDDAYSVYALVLDSGLDDGTAGFAGGALAGGLVLALIVLARKGDERGAFVLAIATALAATPIVWRHYFELLLVAVAVARPRLGVVWFVPVLMWWVSTGSGNGTPFQTAATLVIASLTVALALRETSLRRADLPLGPAPAPAHPRGSS